MTNTERVARILCEAQGYDPDCLEPGNVFGTDGVLVNGDPAHFMWRQFVPMATLITKSIGESIEDALALVYNQDWKTSPQLAVANVCDEVLDKSGALLGRVRDRALDISQIRP